MIMYLNNDKTKSVEVSSYSRDLNIPDPDIRFSLNLSFTGEYPAEGIEYLADFADNDITEIEIVNDTGSVMLTHSGSIARLVMLNETCNEGGKNGYAAINIYEAGVTPSV